MINNTFDRETVICIIEKVLGNNKIDDNIVIERMGGLTNRTYKVVLEENTVVVRLPGEGTEELINRFHKKISTELAGSIGIDTELYFFDEQTGVKVSKFIDASETMCPKRMKEEKNIVLTAKLLNRLHNCGCDTGVSFDVIDMAENYEKIIKANNVPLYDDYENIKEIISEIKNEYLPNVRKVPCHNDPLCENWILQNEEKIFLIDWEYAGMNDPMWDLADVSIEAGYDDAMDDALLYSYFGIKPDKHEIKAFLVNKVLIDYLWSLWGKTRVPYDGQEMEEYALERYIRMKKSIDTLNNYIF